MDRPMPNPEFSLLDFMARASALKAWFETMQKILDENSEMRKPESQIGGQHEESQ